MPKRKKSSSQTPSLPFGLLFGGIATVFLVVFIAMMVLGSNPLDTANSNLSDTTNNTATTERVAISFLPPNEFRQRSQAEKYINENQGNTEEDNTWETVVFGIVEDPTQDHTVYFATTDTAGIEGTSQFRGIYKFDTTSYRWERILRNRGEDQYTNTTYHVVGLQDGQLVVLQQTNNEAADICKALEEVDPHRTTYLGLDTDEPTTGLQTITPDERIVKNLEQEIARCLD